LVLSERLKMMQEDLHSELIALSSTISLMDKDSYETVYLSSIPQDFQGMSIHVPHYTGSFLMLSSSEEKDAYPDPKTILMKQAGRGRVYFGSYFYTPEQKGYLELLLRRSPGSAELEYLQMNLLQLSGAITNEQLIRQLEDSKNLLENSYDEILMTWVRIMELRNIENKGHNKQVVGISLKLAELLGLSREKMIHLRRGALLHDIGKLGIPDSILHKPSALNKLERDIIRRHPQIGRDSLINIPFLREAIPVIYSHHERWNGKGYPEGLKKVEIPILARIFIIADIYDSLTSDRSDRMALPQEEALLYMKDQKG
jgi:HD-GYP domain-containing protein (c-di-GMP phosphodiesterase class II)